MPALAGTAMFALCRIAGGGSFQEIEAPLGPPLVTYFFSAASFIAGRLPFAHA